MTFCLDLVASHWDRQQEMRRWGLSETQLEMRKNTRSKTQGNGIKAYLSFYCLVHAPLMGHSSFIYSTQKPTCQTTHRLYLSKSWKARDSGLKNSSASLRAAAALRRHGFSSYWSEPYISKVLFFEFQQAWSWQLFHLFFSFFPPIFPSKGVLRWCCFLCRTQQQQTFLSETS